MSKKNPKWSISFHLGQITEVEHYLYTDEELLNLINEKIQQFKKNNFPIRSIQILPWEQQETK